MNSSIPAFLASKSHILPIRYSTLPMHSGNVGNATVAMVSVLDDVW